MMSSAELSTTISGLAATTGVVRVGGRRVSGSGFVLADGYVVTNAHNVVSDRVPVVFADGRDADGRVAGVDPDGDLAVIEVDVDGAEPVAWTDDGDVAVGAAVFAPTLHRGGTRVTSGFVSATGRAFRGPRGRLVSDAIEHTAPLARGSSGGPLVDADGRLIGVNTHRLMEGFYLALPATADLRRRLEALRRGEQPRRTRLGIGVAPPGVARRMRAAVGLDERDGLLVQGVETDGPADRAGVRRGDLVVAAEGTPVTSTDDLAAVLDDLDPEATLRLTVVRGSDEIEVAVAFGDTRDEGSA